MTTPPLSALLTANWVGEASHSWVDVDDIGAACEQIVRTATGAWQLADIVSVRCRNDLQNRYMASAQARTLLLLDQAQRTDVPGEVSEAVSPSR